MKKQSKADILRTFGIPEEIIKRGGYSWLRYKQPLEKGILWYYFSIYIRQRDVKKWGRCISCDRPITFDSCDAGHFMPSRDCGRDLIFDEVNVNAECSQCNAWDETHLLGYAENLDKRYGIGTAAELRRRRDEYKNSQKVVKDWTRLEYGLKAQEMRARISA